METLALMIKDINRGLGDSKITPEQLTIPLINSWKKRIFQGTLVAASFPPTYNRGQEDA
ncbi:MAG: hypothetical protein RXN92_04910 [Thermoplasmatales archaeon]